MLACGLISTDEDSEIEMYRQWYRSGLRGLPNYLEKIGHFTIISIRAPFKMPVMYVRNTSLDILSSIICPSMLSSLADVRYVWQVPKLSKN
jgi:hypothetical protein